ncbi:LacI family DNA-binding transcriptional regulator [Kitasatospora sp. NPDC094015]|uniref:LacI family DNA-binding transcriptional regulator n=1 Tax=Kitasatospora sp. NPDC094015 TaxID=3155205 RepID=UPI00331A0F89
MAVTLGDVARHAGVSLATASRVLNGSARTVTDELSARVRSSAQELGYLPNAPAQALARASTATIGVLLHDVADPYFGAIARAVGDASSKAGLLSLVASTDADPEQELHAVRMLHAQRVRAIVLAGSAYTDPAAAGPIDEALAGYRAQGGVVTAITEHGPGYDTVSPANRAGAAELVRALIGMGHRRFAVIGGPERLRVSQERLAGVREALTEAELTLPQDCVLEADFSREGGRRAAARLVDGHPGELLPTAILALSDICAVGVLAELRARGIDVPGRVSVAGFDDVPLAADLAPPLTSVRMPLELMGREAVRLALAATPGAEPQVVALPLEVVLRASTAPPARA